MSIAPVSSETQYVYEVPSLYPQEKRYRILTLPTSAKHLMYDYHFSALLGKTTSVEEAEAFVVDAIANGVDRSVPIISGDFRTRIERKPGTADYVVLIADEIKTRPVILPDGKFQIPEGQEDNELAQLEARLEYMKGMDIVSLVKEITCGDEVRMCAPKFRVDTSCPYKFARFVDYRVWIPVYEGNREFHQFTSLDRCALPHHLVTFKRQEINHLKDEIARIKGNSQ